MTRSRVPIAGLPSGLVRPREERVVAGVCAGVARHLSVDPLIVRLATCLLTLANGVGVVLYLAAWAVIPDEHASAAPTASRRTSRRASIERAAAIGCITLGVLLLVRWAAPFFPDQLVWPATLAAVGLGLVWARGDDTDRSHRRELTAKPPSNPVEAVRRGRGLWLRLVLGTVLLIAGIGTFIDTSSAFAAVGQIGAAVLATILGVGLLFGPWILRLWRQLGAERRERIRSEERADMAAHLHDSVLQTLALIQRNAEATQETRNLARRQERELRAWLYGDRRTADAGSAGLAAALDNVADEVEADHSDVAVDVVVVGDRSVDEQVEALIGAVREAVVNAAKHSGESEISVYVEVDAASGDVNAFVRDRGRGFDPRTVNGDRRGIAQSIVRRMSRNGGSAEIHSAPGEGTEVVLVLHGAGNQP